MLYSICRIFESIPRMFFGVKGGISMNTGDIIMNKIKPWQSEEQYEKAVDFLENRHRNLWKEGTIAKSVSWSYIIKGRCFQFPRGAVEVPEEAKKISKKHPLPYIPKFFATENKK